TKSKSTCKIDDPKTCINGVCKQNYLEGPQCKCNNGFVKVADKCREIVYVDYSEDCKTSESGPVPICYYENSMQCNSSGNCGCIIDNFYDEENNTCLTKDAYVEKYPEETLGNDVSLYLGFVSLLIFWIIKGLII
ncbi:unnamed protein product, partial [Meganyctiphanes norvegica]